MIFSFKWKQTDATKHLIYCEDFEQCLHNFLFKRNFLFKVICNFITIPCGFYSNKQK